MTQVMVLQPPALDLDRILNVSHPVGPRTAPRVVNERSDVEAVQRLIAIAGRPASGRDGFTLPAPTGTFDVVTGYWVLRAQMDQLRHSPSEVVDGVVSPARDGRSGYGAGTFWTIVLLNYWAKGQSAAEWAALLQGQPSGGVLSGIRVPAGAPYVR